MLRVKPGITSPATVLHRHEEDLLTGPDWEDTYRRRILPAKLEIELAYLHRRTLADDVRILARTVCALFRQTHAPWRGPGALMAESRSTRSGSRSFLVRAEAGEHLDRRLPRREAERARIAICRSSLKRKWLVTAVAALVFGAVAAWTLTTDRIYTSSVNIQIDPEQSVLPYKEMYAAVVPDPRYLGTQAQVLKSEALARRTVVRLELAKDTDKAGQLARWFASNVTVVPVEGTQVVKVTYKSDDPQFAARAVNVLADEYIRYGFESKRDATGVARDFLQEELTKLQQKLQQSEQRLVDYGRGHNILLPSRDNNVIMRKLTELNDEMTKVEAAGPGHRIRRPAGDAVRELSREAQDPGDARAR